MATYEQCDSETYDRMRAIMKKHHPLLHKAGVTVCCLFAYAPKDEETGTPVGPALKSGGYAAAAVIKIMALKERVKGNADAEMLIDGDRWESWPEDQQAALLDHELQHLEPKYDGSEAKPRFLLDAHERPVLKARKHDHQYGWFNVIAERHGIASLEVQQSTRVFETLGQLYFPFSVEHRGSAAEAIVKAVATAKDVLRESRGGDAHPAH